MWAVSLAVCLLITIAVVAVENGGGPGGPPRQLIQPFSDHLNGALKDGRVFGGQDAVAGQFPYQVALFDPLRRAFFCSGAIISKLWVVTAGHCVDWTRNNIVVRIGILRLNEPVTEDRRLTTTPSDRTLHPNYNLVFLDNDIAVIKLPTSITFTQSVAPVLLPSYADTVSSLAGQSVVISGWGKIGDYSPQTNNILQWAEIYLSDNRACEEEYGTVMIGTKICAETASSKESTCKGDSGGPIVIAKPGKEYLLVAIVSFGHPKGCALGKPVGFTRVTSFLGFIEDATGIDIQD